MDLAPTIVLGFGRVKLVYGSMCDEAIRVLTLVISQMPALLNLLLTGQ
jgi:hypothetical protein